MTNMAGEEDIEVDCLVLWVIVIWTQLGLVGVEVREGREKKIPISSPSISSAHLRWIRVATLNSLVFFQGQVSKSTHPGSCK